MNKNILSEKYINFLIQKRKTIVFILLFAFLLVFIHINKYNLHPDNLIVWIEDSIKSIGAGRGYPFEIAEQEILCKNIKFLNSNLAILTDTEYITLNNSAKIIFKRAHNFNNPILKANGVKCISYDCGGNSYKIDTSSRNLYSGSTNNRIICGDISKNGVYGLVTDSDTYLSELIVFNKNNTQKYKYFFAKFYVNNISINANGTKALVSGVLADNCDLKSVIYLLDFSQNEPIAIFEINDDYIIDIKFFNNQNIIAMGSKSVRIFNKNLNLTSERHFEYKNLATFNIDESGCALCLKFSNSGVGNEIFYINASGEFNEIAYLKNDIDAIFSKDSEIFILSIGNLITYNINGTYQNEFFIGTNIKNILMSPNIKIYYAFSKNCIYKIRI